MLGQRDVHIQLVRLVVHADDLAFVHRRLRFDEEVATCLQTLHGVRSGDTLAIADHGTVLAGHDLASPRSVAGGDGGCDTGATGGGKQCGAEADQTTGRHGELQTNPASAMVGHVLHTALTVGEQLGDRAHVLFRNVDGGVFHRFVDHAVDGLGDHLRAADGQLIAFTTHLFGKHGQGELATTLDFPCIRAFGRQHLDGHVADEFAVKAILDHAGGKLVVLAFGSGKRGIVDAESHGDGRIINVDQRQRARIGRINDGFADHDVIHAGDCDDVARARGIDRGALKTLRTQQFGDAEVFDGAVHTGQTVGLALFESAVVDTHQAESTQEIRGIDVGDVCLQRRAFLVFRSRNVLDDGFEQRFEIFVIRQTAILRLVFGSVAGLGRAVDDRQVEQRILIEIDTLFDNVLSQAEQQIGGFSNDLFDTCVRTIGLVHAQDNRQLGFQSLAQHEAGLRQRAFGCVDEQHDAINHGDATLDLAAEIGVTRSIDDVEGDAFRMAVLGGQRTGVLHSGVLGEDGDALLTFQIIGIHHTIRNFLTFVEHVGLCQHGIDQRGLAVIDVCHNRYISNIAANRHRNLS